MCFSRDISISNSWGYRTPEHDFDGIAGDLERGIIDYGSSPLMVRPDRAEVLQYGMATWILR